ncbi:MAG: putative LPS assembly protein LptD, partial [Candidatus Zixiibacteriota bacterium]
TNLDERLNRVVKSQVSFKKEFGKKVSLSGRFTHNVDLDRRTRSDVLPSASLSLPTIWIFGSGSRDSDGRLQQRWYHNFTFRYNPSMLHVSNRQTTDSVFVVAADTSLVIDTLTWDTTTTITVTDTDTVSYRTRRKYVKINHNPHIGLPTIKLAKYILLTPSVSYNETWIKVIRTDQSDNAGIDASRLYRTYSFSSSVGLKTALYGTVYPHLMGLEGLRHVFEPAVSYVYSPKIDRHPDVRSFVGGAAGSSKKSLLAVSLRQIFQAKVKKGEIEQNLELLSVKSSFSYNFEQKDRPFSDLSTTFQTSTLPNVLVSGSMCHSFYRPGTNEIEFWSPFLMSFGFDVTFSLSGKRFFFDDDLEGIPRGAASPLQAGGQPEQPAPKGWRLSATYSYSGSGRDQAFRKASFLRFNLSFNLTPNASVSYSQQYDIVDKKTVNSRVRIERKIHCWTGSLWWVPTGSNRGFGFRLNVTALPEIKIDQNFDTFDSGLLQRR